MCFSPYLGGGGGAPKGSGARSRGSGLGGSKMEISKTAFFDILSIQNDQISYAKRVLASLCVFHPIGGGGGAPKGSGARSRGSGLGGSKMEISKTAFFDILSIQNDQISYAKRALASLCVFHPIWVEGGGGAPKGFGTQPAIMQFSSLSSSEMVVPLPSSRCLAQGNRILRSPTSFSKGRHTWRPSPLNDDDFWIWYRHGGTCFQFSACPRIWTSWGTRRQTSWQRKGG